MQHAEEVAARGATVSLIDRMADLIAREAAFFSFEYFPPSTVVGTRLLQQRTKRMARLEPLWVDVTWSSLQARTAPRRARGALSDASPEAPVQLPPSGAASLALCGDAQESCGVHAMLHLTCRGMTVVQLRLALSSARERGIRSILALRGDAPADDADDDAAAAATAPAAGGMALLARMRAQRRGPAERKGGAGAGARRLTRAVDLVRLIRSEHGDFFTIAVAGHPHDHPDSVARHGRGGGGRARAENVRHLKQKVDAGADFVLLQLSFSADAILEYIAQCRDVGIAVPIVPGLMAPQSLAALRKFAESLNDEQ